MNRWCGGCGAKIGEGAAFCEVCGRPVSQPQMNTQQQFDNRHQQPSAFGGQSSYEPPYNYQSQNHYHQPPQAKQMNIMGLVGFVLGAVSWLLNFWGIVGTTAIVFSAISLSKFDKVRENYYWMPIVGLISGIANVLYAVVYLVIFSQFF